jgi:hypothetical protein
VKIRSWPVSELGGERLPTFGWYHGTVENHAEGTTESALVIAEDA